jgi:hypothetical protein
MDRYLRKLPVFAPVLQSELRALWRQHPDTDIRRLILEIERYRRTLDELYDIYSNVHQSWRDTVGGELVGLHQMKQVLTIERGRLGSRAWRDSH